MRGFSLHYWVGGTFIWLITCRAMPSVPTKVILLIAPMPDAREGPLLPRFTQQPKWDQKSKIIAKKRIWLQRQ